MSEQSHIRILDWGNGWLTIEVDNRRHGLENYPYKEPFVTWVRICLFLEQVFSLPVCF